MNISKIATFRAFKSRNYTLYFWGRAISQIGTWMQRTAVVWIMYTLTHSSFMLGVTIFAEQFPSFLLSVAGGVVADRYNRYKVINLTQIISMIQAILLAVLIISKHYVVWEILVLSIILGIVNAFDIPARQSMINEMVENKEDLPSALSLSASTANLARILGPALSGIILESLGAGICFIINAVSFGCVMIAFMMMELKPYKSSHQKKNVFAELIEGFTYLKKSPAIGMIVLMLSVVSLLVLPYETLIPVFAKKIFNGNAATYGYITSFIGLGAISGTVFLASLKQNSKLRRVLILATILLSIGLIGFSHTNIFPVAMIFAVAIGIGSAVQFTISNIIVQTDSANYMRGRAISILLMAMFGMLPLGSLLIGFMSEKIGPNNTMFAQGIIAIIIAIVFYSFMKKKRVKNNIVNS